MTLYLCGVVINSELVRNRLSLIGVSGFEGVKFMYNLLEV